MIFQALKQTSTVWNTADYLTPANNHFLSYASEETWGFCGDPLCGVSSDLVCGSEIWTEDLKSVSGLVHVDSASEDITLVPRPI